LQNDHYAHKIKEIVSFNEDGYEILLYFNFHILFVRVVMTTIHNFFNNLINFIVICEKFITVVMIIIHN